MVFTDNSTNAVAWQWDFGDGVGTSTASNPSYDDHGCMDTAYQRVVVFGDFKMFVPTAFSPNGDGVNDFFYPGGIYFDAADFLMQIYNRWGKLIWETRTPGQGWDGRDQNTGEFIPEIQNQTGLSWIQAEFIPPVSDVCSGQLSITEEEQQEGEFRVRPRTSSAVYVESSTGRRSSPLLLMPPKWWVEGNRLTLREGVAWGWDLMRRLLGSWDKPGTWPLPTGPLYLTDTEGHSLKVRLEE